MNCAKLKYQYVLIFGLFSLIFSPLSAESDAKSYIHFFEGYINDEDNFVDRVRIVSLDDDSDIALFELSLNDDGSSFTVLNSIEVGKNMTDFPSVEFHNMGRISVHTGCSAVCGRYDSKIEYKIIYRKNMLRLAGYTRITTDRLSAEVSICDVNLLNQKAEIGFLDNDVKLIQHQDSAILLNDFDESYVPEICLKN